MTPSNKSENDDITPITSNASLDSIEEVDQIKNVSEGPEEFASNNLNNKSKFRRMNLECNRKSFSIDSLLFSSKQYQLKPPSLLSNEVNDCPTKHNE